MATKQTSTEQTSTEQATTEETTKKPRAKKSETTKTNPKKSVTMTEEEATELKALAENLHLSESELIKIAIKAIAANANIIHEAQEKTAYPVELIVTNGISRYAEQLVKQENIGIYNEKMAEAYETIKATLEECKRLNKKPKFRSVVSKLTTMVGTNYKTAERWVELNHPEELNKTK